MNEKLARFGYILCIPVSYGVMYYINGKVGLILLVLLLFALGVSLCYLAFLVRFGFELKIKYSDDRIYIRFFKWFVPFTPIIETQLVCSKNISAEGGNVQTFVHFKGFEEELSIPIIHRHIGAGKVEIKKIFVKDFLGITYIDIATKDVVIEFSVFPKITDVSHQTELLRRLSFFAEDEDDEDESGDMSYISTGIPGFEHREYISGDPIKRINWKLSAKKNKYMVRLDDNAVSHGPTFLFDCPLCEEDDFSLTARDNVINGMISVISTLSSDGLVCVLYIFIDSEWRELTISSREDADKLTELFANYRVSLPESLIPDALKDSYSPLVCFSTAVKGYSTSVENICREKNNIILISSNSAELGTLPCEHWVVSENAEFLRM